MKKTILRGCSIQTQGKSRRKRAVRRRGTRGSLEGPSPPLSSRGSLKEACPTLPPSPQSKMPLRFITLSTSGFRSVHWAAMLLSFPSQHLIQKLLSPLHPNTLVFLFFQIPQSSAAVTTMRCSSNNGFVPNTKQRFFEGTKVDKKI